MPSREDIVRMEGITKRFPGVVANDNIDFEVRKGEIHALVGENGAGKTTLMNVLYGLYAPDAGRIYIRGEEVDIGSPQDAISHNIGMVHQHFTLVPPFTVTKNIVLGIEFPRGLLDLKGAEEDIRELSEAYGIEIDPEAEVRDLSVGEKQRVEILKALYRGAEILILDEPTAVLTPQESEGLFETLETLSEEGTSIVYISHKLDEVLEISDRITVLREGKKVATKDRKEVDRSDLAELMVGREVVFRLEKPDVEIGGPLLEIKELSALDDQGLPALKNVSLTVREGEILGIAGVAGNGQNELFEVISGMREVSDGSVIVNGRDMTDKSPAEMVEAGLGRIPEDRMEKGIVPDFSVSNNLIAEVYSDFSQELPFFPSGFFLNYSSAGEYADEQISEYGIITPDRDTMATALSGGNIQKLVLARILAQDPLVVVASQPTRGLDVGSAEDIRRRLLETKKRGKGVFLISEDLDEIFDLSDRIAVIYEGEIMGVVPVEEVDKREVGLMMTGTPIEDVKEE